MKTISFVAASSDSGKTTLIEKVVRILKARGVRLAVVKHAATGFDIDHPGKDSWRFREAGADAVLLVGPDTFALQRRAIQEPSSDEIERLVGDVDVIIQEGFKGAGGERIEVYRSGVSGERPLCADDRTFLALVSDRKDDYGIPWFDLDDAGGVAEFIAAKL